MGAFTNADVMRLAVERDGGLCVTCGRRCREHEVRQRIVVDKAPDDPMNWVAMCEGCQGALAERMPPPAQFVYHIHDKGKLFRQCHRIAKFSLLGITGMTWTGFALLLGYLMYLGASGVGWHLFMMLSAFFLLAWAWKFFDAYYEGNSGNVQQVRHVHEPQVVYVKESR